MKTHKRRITKKYILVSILLLSLITGCLIGGIAAASMDGLSYRQLTQNMDEYLINFHKDDRMEMFKESSFKYGKLFVILWLLAFMPLGGFAVMLLILLRGLSYGFTTVALIRCYGNAGSAVAAILYMPQAFLLIPAYMFTGYKGISFAIDNHKANEKLNYFPSYIAILFIGCLCSAVAAFIDAFIVPGMINNFL